MALGYRGAANRDGPSPIIYDRIPEALIKGTDPGLGHGFFDDFVLGVGAATGSTTLPGWIASVVGSGTLVAGTTEGGSIVLTPSGTENQGIQIQTSEAYYADTDCMLAFGARFSVADADQTDTYVGLSIHDTDVAQSIPDDNIGFSIVDASASIYTNIELSGTPTNTDTGVDAEDAVVIRLECLVDREEAIHFYIDGVEYISGTAVTYLPLDQQLAMTVAQVNGAGAANAMVLHWCYAWQWYI